MKAMKFRFGLGLGFAAAVLLATWYLSAANSLGIFEGASDVGLNPKGGAAEFLPASNAYHITGGGANIWATEDAFHYVWRRVSGDVTLTADIRFEGAGVQPHRKAVLMIRQDLTPSAAYADAALHGDGLTSLQYRLTPGGQTQEIQSPLKGPVRLRIERRGNQFTLYAGNPGGELTASGPVTVELKDPVYVGLGVCSHDANVLETAVFTNVQLNTGESQTARRAPRYRSTITIYDLETRSARTVYAADTVWEAPNWTPDGKYLIANSGGRIYRFDANAKGPVTPEPLAIDPRYNCNNDHGPSWDGRQLAFSASSPSSRQSQVYVSDADGRNARLVTPKAPSYFHGWSPDNRWLTFIAERGDKNYDVYRIPAAGSEEERLTTSTGYEDGSEYSPDGKWIYYNSDRAGNQDIWRMPATGAGPGDLLAERITSDELQDWFPHISPDGKRIVFLSFPPEVKDHNGRMQVQLRLIEAPGEVVKPARIETLVRIMGGQGTINVNSWSPDSKKFAYVTYELLPQTSRFPITAVVVRFERGSGLGVLPGNR